MTRPQRTVAWRPRLTQHAGPAYRAIADALEADVRAGRLAAGDPLPTQRQLAARIGVNFTTVTRGSVLLRISIPAADWAREYEVNFPNTTRY